MPKTYFKDLSGLWFLQQTGQVLEQAEEEKSARQVRMHVKAVSLVPGFFWYVQIPLLREFYYLFKGQTIN